MLPMFVGSADFHRATKTPSIAGSGQKDVSMKKSHTKAILKQAEKLEEIKAKLEYIRDELSDLIDIRTVAWFESEAGQQVQSKHYNLNNATKSLQELIDSFRGIADDG